MFLFGTLNNNSSEALMDTIGVEPPNDTVDESEGDVDDVALVGEDRPTDDVGESEGEGNAVALVGEARPNVDVQKETDFVNVGLDQLENTEEIAVNDENASSSALAISDAVVDAEERTEENTEDVEKHSNKKGKKAQANSKKNRNVRRALVTVKNKIETIQENSGGTPNYLLLLEDNFSDLHSSGRKTTMNRKILVAAGGELREAFKTGNVKCDLENMLVLKKGKNLKQDFSFLDEYLSSRTAPSSSLQSSPTALVNSLVQQLLSAQSSGRKKRKSSKKRRRFETSSDSESSDDSFDERRRKKSQKKKKVEEYSDESSDDSERRKPKRKKRNKKKEKVVEVFDDSTSSEDDVSALDSSDECDNDPLHGTLQKPNLKTKKKPPARQIKGRKVKHDMLIAPPKKVYTPGNFPEEDGAQNQAGGSKAVATKKAGAPKAGQSKAGQSKAGVSKTVPEKQVGGSKVVARAGGPSSGGSKAGVSKAGGSKTVVNKARVSKPVSNKNLKPATKDALEVPKPTDEENIELENNVTIPPMQKVSQWIDNLPIEPYPGQNSNAENVPPKQIVKPNSKLTRQPNNKSSKVVPKPGPSGQIRALKESNNQNPAKSVKNPAKPVQNPAKPVQNPGKPVQNPAKPVQKSAKPVQNSAKPVQDPAKPVQRKLFKDMTDTDIENMLDEDKTPTRKKK